MVAHRRPAIAARASGDAAKAGTIEDVE